MDSRNTASRSFAETPRWRRLCRRSLRGRCAVVAGEEPRQCGGDVALPVVQVHGDSQGAEALGALQLVQLQLLDVRSEVPQTLQVLDVLAPLLRLARMRIDERDLPWLGEALGRVADCGLVDPLLDDLVPHAVRP